MPLLMGLNGIYSDICFNLLIVICSLLKTQASQWRNFPSARFVLEPRATNFDWTCVFEFKSGNCLIDPKRLRVLSENFSVCKKCSLQNLIKNSDTEFSIVLCWGFSWQDKDPKVNIYWYLLKEGTIFGRETSKKLDSHFQVFSFWKDFVGDLISFCHKSNKLIDEVSLVILTGICFCNSIISIDVCL